MYTKRIISALAKKLLVFVLAGGIFFTSSAQYAHAQWATTNPDILANDLASAISSQAADEVKGALLGALAGIGISMLDYVATMTAQSTAVWIANGASGQHPLFNTQTMEEVGQSISATVVSDVLDQVVPGAGSLAAIGINPNNPELTGILRKLLGSPYRPVQLTQDGRLDGGSIGRNFSSYIASTAALGGGITQGGGEAGLKVVADIMNAASMNEFSGLLRAYGQTQARAGRVAAVGQYQYLLKDGFRDLTSPISNKVKWPAASVKKKLDDAISAKQQNDADIAKGLVQAAGEDAVLQVGINFLTTFTGTLFGELTQKLFDGLFDGLDPVTINPFDPSQVSVGRTGENLFRSIGTFRPLRVSGYSLTAQLASCPATMLRSSRGVYTCAMDTAFVSVVTRGNSSNPSTLREAIENGEIKGNWPLVGPDSTLNKDPNCYQRAFCHSNILKLRKARIVPIGWEMAASFSGDGRYTLQQAMDGFYDCNADGERDADHPLCKLVDPNWILRAPEAVCRTLAYGQQLATSAGANRAEECVDIQTCLEEDANGECKGGFGYCVREANIWRFRGDVCTQEAASCQALAARDNTQVSYLLNTVDYAECGPDKVGCRWYETEKTVDSEGNFDWPSVHSVEQDIEEEFGNTSRVYVNATVETCEDGGCRELVTRTPGLVYNMVQNGSFEDDADNNRFPDGWLRSNTTAEIIPGQGIANGAALRAGAIYPGLLFDPGLEYTLTASARTTNAAAGAVSALLTFNVDNPNDGAFTLDFAGYRLEPLDSTMTCAQVPGTNTIRVQKVLNASGEYARLGCTFVVPNLGDTIRSVAGTLTLQTDSGVILFDDVQVEQRAQASSYAFSYSQNTAKTYAKLPPAYLGCTGGPGDAAACANYAKVCSPLDEGCTLYTPTNGDPAVSAIVGASNACPAVCSGYDTFKQEPTFYETEGVFPEYFIPATATRCSANAAGCDEFTNLSTEGKEYYSYLRACLNEARAGAREGIFYTWEGTDTQGYQIKTWNLLATNMTEASADNVIDAQAPCTQWNATSEGITCADDTAPADGVPDTTTDASCNERADIFTNPDCREFYDSQGNIHYRLWSKTVSVNAACTSYRKTEIAGADRAAQVDNCENSGGYFDTPTGSCIYYGYSTESTACSANENGCRVYTGGRGNNARLVMEEYFENGTAATTGEDTIPGWDASAGGDIGLSTESLANEGTSIRSVGTKFWTYYAKINEASCATSGGCVDRASRFGEQCTVQQGRNICGSLPGRVFAGKTYTLQFWAKGEGAFDVGFAQNAPANEDAVQPDANLLFAGANQQSTLELSSEWKEYRLGPIDVNERNFADFGPESVLVFRPASANTVLYVDTIILREGEENIAIIRDSWSTPAVCDTDLGGNYSPQFALGCREYASSAGGRVYLKSFSRLCGENNVGCSAYFDTQASDSPYGEIFNGYCTRIAPGTDRVECHLETDLSDATVFNAQSPRLCTIQPGNDSCQFNLGYYVPEVNLRSDLRTAHISYEADTEVVSPDMPVYAVITPGSQCNVADAGCTEVGIPVLSADQSRVATWQTDTLLLDPDNFRAALCDERDLFCEEYTDAKQDKYYFRDPQQKVCEYKDKVTIDGTEYSGWFIEGTTNFCYGLGRCEANSALACVTDDECPVLVDTSIAGTTATQGVCSVFGGGCTQDSDCRLNESCLGVTADVCVKDDTFGRCSQNAALACSSDADCGGGNTCIASTERYVISGNESGLWRAGDSGYDGWVGTCDPANSGCREFLDPLDGLEADTPYGQAENKTYYYIENENLGDSNIAAGARCNGKASTEEGCVLFHDTSLPRLTYNTSATAIASAYADELFGTRKYDLFTPISCNEESSQSSITTPSGGRVDLCAQRCVYDQFRVNDIGSNYAGDLNGDGVQDTYGSATDFLGAIGTLPADQLEDAYILGGSCMIDNDCAPIRSSNGELVNGSCRGSVFNTIAQVDENTTRVPRLENDTNRVLKVNRNRTCAEWIAPDDCRKVWDPELNQFRESCSRLILCEEYDESGVFACKKPKKLDTAVPIDLDFYTSRNTSWYGNDYSGYAIGGQFLLNHITQEQVNSKLVCVLPAPENSVSGAEEVYFDASGAMVPCTQQSECAAYGATCKQNPDPEYALAYNSGSCEVSAPGTLCAVGYCADSGAACANGSQCPGSSCVVGRCVAPVLEAGVARRCAQDSDCGSAGAVCNAGICQEDLGLGCNIEVPGTTGDDGQFGCTALRADAFCNISTNYRAGSCYNQKCLLTPTGEPYPSRIDQSVGVTGFGKVCRANPEIDSPFSTDLVEEWNTFQKINGASGYGARWGVASSSVNDDSAYPYNVRSGFENANICAPGEICSCSYKKLAASGKTQYVEIDTSLDLLRDRVAKDLGRNPAFGQTLGICAGGPADGAFCVVEGGTEFGCKSIPETDPTATSPNDFASGTFGTCNPINREDQLVGLKGYCLERDSSISIDGNPDLGACLTYFPIDELRGETDLYGKYKEAGFFEDAFYCTEVGTYANVGAVLGCSAIRGNNETDPRGTGDSNCLNTQNCWRQADACKWSVTCPSGWFAVVGPHKKHGLFNGDSAHDSLYAANMCGSPGSMSNAARENGTVTDVNRVALTPGGSGSTFTTTTGSEGTNFGCPYVCVPPNSARDSGDNEGDSCSPPKNQRDGISASGTSFYYYQGDEIDTRINDYLACRSFGVDLAEVDDTVVRGVYELLEATGAGAGAGDTPWDPHIVTGAPIESLGATAGYGVWELDYNGDERPEAVIENPFMATEYYPACRTTSQLSSTEGSSGAAPYTDRLLNQVRNYVAKGALGLSYFAETQNKPFGATLNPIGRTVNYYGHSESAPFAIPSCVTRYWMANRDEMIDDDDGDSVYQFDDYGTSFSGAEIRRPRYFMPYGFNMLIGGVDILTGVSDCLYNWAANDGIGDLEDATRNYGNMANGPTEAMPFVAYGVADRAESSWDHIFTNIVEFKENKVQLMPGEDYGEVASRLGALFAQTLENAAFVWDAMFMNGTGNAGSYRLDNTSFAVEWDVRATGDIDYVPTPPRIWSVDFNNCKGRNCREGSVNQLSLNGQTGQDFVVNEDGYFRASVEFFAAASKEQLPIRRIIVEWGDGQSGELSTSGSPEADNYYKNHRGLDPLRNDESYCGTNAEWGMTADSCEPTWLRYTKTYVCGDDAQELYGACGENGETDVNCYDTAARECRFQPRVHVRDNWGWCGGTCEGDNGCFSAQGLDEVGAGYSAPENQCNYEEFPNPNRSIPNNNWIEYSGLIRIKQ